MANERFMFMAWDKKNKSMHNVAAIEFIDAVEGRPGVNAFTNEKNPRKGHWIEWIDLELMQFTGLLDKNNKPIFEGYIVSLIMLSDNNDTYIGEVIFDLSHCTYLIKVKHEDGEDDFYHLVYPCQDGRVSVIGNIYEHPHLLTQKP